MPYQISKQSKKKKKKGRRDAKLYLPFLDAKLYKKLKIILLPRRATWWLRKEIEGCLLFRAAFCTIVNFLSYTWIAFEKEKKMLHYGDSVHTSLISFWYPIDFFEDKGAYTKKASVQNNRDIISPLKSILFY